MSLKYAIIGTGAIGGYYGARLAKVGKDVHFLLHSDYNYVKQHGLRVDSVDGDFTLAAINAYDSTKDMPRCDVVLVCLKSTNNHLLKNLLPPLLHKDTLVILIQNGLGLEEDLHQEFPGLHIAGGLAFICSSKVGEGHIAHFDYGKLNLGSYSCKDINILEQVCSDLVQAGIETQILELELARWMKLVWNIPYNGMTVVLNTATDILMNNPSTYTLLRDMMLEVIRAANYVGKGRFSIPESYADQMLEMTRQMTPYSPSMKLDFDSCRPLEIDYIYTHPVAEAGKAGYEMSRVSMLEKQLRFIQDQYIKK
ncbi:putative 2-dehydropantoate 2-reductase [Dysgonomonas sp. 521]|uniref:putative 2-dehydropantoate 2-reductase n=1 Tax=Dysgonomonas sp. 521 TaxID=2302932 RepID=UPI0013D488C7|nr:putative 2-dehydropantoate 2-reductase [Dysgonomonas sp. 521]NDV95982.1 putative 2-dehydropantoate 2-reductase [Dysgonomonas sp. 521]